MHRRRRVALLACLAALAAVSAGCGSKSHPNELRIPDPISVTAYISNKEVRVQPGRFGAGIVNFSIANQSSGDASLTLQGPVDASSTPIPAGGTGNLKVDLKTGDYAVSAGSHSGAAPQVLSVGPERRSAQNDLLLP
jgi:hypothetical protein